MAHLGITALLEGLSEKDFYSNGDEFISELKPCGLKGIEVYHSSHNRWQGKLLLFIAQEHNLLVTGGSDFHGVINYKNRDIGRGGITLDQFNKIKTA